MSVLRFCFVLLLVTPAVASAAPGAGSCTLGYSSCSTESYHTVAEANPWLTNEPGTDWCHLYGAASTQAEADQIALGACQAAGCTTCQITRRWAGNTCLARADNATTRFYGWAAAPSQATAERQALAACQQSGGGDPPSGGGAALENPAPGSLYSGIGVISGWKCTADGALTVRFNGGDPIPLAYGNERSDVREAGACPGANVGFVSIWNWAKLDAGEHTAVVYDAGVEFARSTFRVESLGREFLRGVTGESVVRNFPSPNTDVVVRWEEPIQQFVVAQVSDGGAAAGQCCRWISVNCGTATATEREYGWRNAQVRAGTCVTPPLDDTGLVGVVRHIYDGPEHWSDYDGDRVWDNNICGNLTDLGMDTVSRWTPLSPSYARISQEKVTLEWVYGPYTCGSVLVPEIPFTTDNYGTTAVYGVALDGRPFRAN